MKNILSIFILPLTFSGFLSAPIAAGEPAAIQNPFQEALDIGYLGRPKVPLGEDLASPFANAHPEEQRYYALLYYSQYGIAPFVMKAVPKGGDGSQPGREIVVWNDGTRGAEPVDKRVPKPTDAQGFPLWFDGSIGEQAIGRLVSELLNQNKTAQLDHLFDDWSDSGVRTADGRWRLAIYQQSVKDILQPGANWEVVHQIITDWRKASPKSRAAAFAETIYWMQYAWLARGDGYANSVTDDGWRLFGERLDKAKTLLLEAQSYAGNNPLWRRLMVEVGLYSNWPHENLLRLANDATTREKTFEPTYIVMVTALEPKWGGDWADVDAYIRAVQKDTAAVAGQEFYTRLYLDIADSSRFDTDLFTDTRAQWPLMKAGFEDMMRAYPHSGTNLNLFAVYACIANDAETYRHVRWRLGKEADATLWPSNHSLDLCDHKYGGPPI